MAFKNVGTMDLGTFTASGASAAAGGNAGRFTMDAAGIASGQAFLTSELEKRDMMVRTPLTSFTYARDIPVRVGGGWAETVSAMQVGYGIAGGSGDNLAHAGGANGIPMVQANFDKGTYKTHMTGRNLDSLVKDGVRLTYDKHMDENTYVGFQRLGTTGIINNADVTVTNAASTGADSGTTFASKTPDQILADVNNAILLAWAASEYDNDAIPNHILMPYEQYNYLATTKVSDQAEKTILKFLLDNNVAAQNGSDLFIGGCRWCKGAGGSSKDRMVVYCNKERYLAMDELAPLTRAMTGPNTAHFCFDTAYAANLSETETFYDNTMLYVDGI